MATNKTYKDEAGQKEDWLLENFEETLAWCILTSQLY